MGPCNPTVPNECCMDAVGAQMPCVNMGSGPQRVSPMRGAQPDCKYAGMPGKDTPKGSCGWDDPDAGVRAACEHGNIVCGEDGGVRRCMLGPPAQGRAFPTQGALDECKYEGVLCKDTPKGSCGWDDPDADVQAVCEHENIVCGSDG